ncbi:putative lipase Atg15p [[Candida] anglica]|uniref:Putative lipase ATG15 n=1 Tax=[Candida] anglica TaxID=148631 RepID=A0ABP0EM38_9ASCO
MGTFEERYRRKSRLSISSGGGWFAFIIISVYMVWWYHGNYIKNMWGKSTILEEEVINEKSSMDMNGGDSNLFQLKHIFHHGTGAKHYKTHRRLDITPEYLAKSNIEEHFTMLEEKKRNFKILNEDSSLEDIYNELDWPKIHEGKNPFTIQLPMKAQENRGKIQRLAERHTPNFIESYLEHAIKVKGNPSILNKISLEWEEQEVVIPDIKDRDTLVSLASISSNAYVRLPKNEEEKKKSDWIDVGEPWHLADNKTNDEMFGWGEDGIRGHIFVSNDSKTVVIGIKGTSGAGLPGSGSEETSVSDKTNDNLLFSCCCARVGYMWTTVCDCYEKAYTCNQDCLEKELLRQDRYYQAVLDLYRNVTALYPPESTNIWVTGHSLGGALASLLGRTFGIPAVAFEAPGEMLATKRLHLPSPPGLPKHLENIWHIGHTADPIYMGVCNGASSTCNVAGYAMETACHTGKQCVYDVVTDKGWRVNLLNHRIHTVIDEVILQYNETAPCFDQPPCRDCFNWKFVSHDEKIPPNKSKSPTKSISPPTSSKSKHSTTSTTTTTTSSTPTGAPQKCLKRTWYGWCLEWDSGNTTITSYTGISHPRIN